MGKKCKFCGKTINLFQNKIKLIREWGSEQEYVCSESCEKKFYEREKIKEEDLKKDRLEDFKKSSRAYVCNACEYGWESRKSFGIPSMCPHCRSQNIDRYADTKEGIKNFKKNIGLK